HGTRATCRRGARCRLGQVYADYRRGLSEPVAFEDFFLEALLKMAGQIERQLFRADNNETQAAELFRLGLTQIQPQECGRREQERKAVLFDQDRKSTRLNSSH